MSAGMAPPGFRLTSWIPVEAGDECRTSRRAGATSLKKLSEGAPHMHRYPRLGWTARETAIYGKP